jgi:2-dehydropantoate 2-reductase
MIMGKTEYAGKKLRILVYGAGVLGGNLANNLYRSGKDVTVLARGEWGQQIKENGLVIKNKLKLRKTVSRIPVISELTPNDRYDVIFVVVRYSQLDQVIDTLNVNISKNIVLVGNNVRARKYAGLMHGKNVMFAFALSAGKRGKDMIKSIDLKKITIGQLAGAESNEAFIRQIFEGSGYKVVYEPNMEDYLLCHTAFIIPAVFACYYTDGDLRRIKRDKAYINRIIDANIEGYRAIEAAGHKILPESDKDYESESYRKTCYRFYKLMCATPLGKICASDHAMNAVDEMSALNRDIKSFFDSAGAQYPVWQQLERQTGGRI